MIVADPRPDAACTGAPENAKRGGSLTTPAPVAADAATSAPMSSASCESELASLSRSPTLKFYPWLSPDWVVLFGWVGSLM